MRQGCDEAIVEDMIAVFAFVGRNKIYSDKLGFDAEFAAVVREWRPEFLT
ncbi:DUF7673 family protein [Rugamonas violacea]